MKIKELLTDESKWCKGNYAIDKHGCAVGTNSEDACQWCLLGAFWRCYSDKWGGESESVRTKLYAAIKEKTGSLWIPAFNDREQTTFADVKKLVDELDI